MTISIEKRQELLDLAQSDIKQGKRLMPTRDGKPFWRALVYELVFDDDGHPVMDKGRQKRQYFKWGLGVPTIELVGQWFDMGADGFEVSVAQSGNLLPLASSFLDQGIRLMPTNEKKKAFWPCMPYKLKFDDDGNPVMGKYGQERDYSGSIHAHWNLGPTTMDQVHRWIDRGAVGIAAFCGEGSDGLYLFDFDVRRFLNKWLAQDGVLDILNRYKVPIQQTGGDGYQVAVKVEGEVPPNTKYAYAPDPTAKDGRTIAIESRGGPRGYFVAPYSRHPKGTYYKVLHTFGGSWDNIPTITQEELKILENAARAVCEAPHPIKQAAMNVDVTDEAPKSTESKPAPKRTATASKQANSEGMKKLKEGRKSEIESLAFEARNKIEVRLAQARESGEFAGRKSDVIGVVNEVLDIRDTLACFGYMEELSGRWSHPDAHVGGGVAIRNNRSFHHSSNDRMNYDKNLRGETDRYESDKGKKRSRTPFDLICAYDYGGNRAKAIRELAKKLGCAQKGRGFTYYGPEPEAPPGGWQDKNVDVGSVIGWEPIANNMPDEGHEPPEQPPASASDQSGSDHLSGIERPITDDTSEASPVCHLLPQEALEYDSLDVDQYDSESELFPPPPAYEDELPHESDHEEHSTPHGAPWGWSGVRRDDASTENDELFKFINTVEQLYERDDEYLSFDLGSKVRMKLFEFDDHLCYFNCRLYVNRSCDLSNKRLYAQRIKLGSGEIFVVEPSTNKRAKDTAYQIVKTSDYYFYLPLVDDDPIIVNDPRYSVSPLIRGDIEDEETPPPTYEQELNAYPLRPEYLKQGPTYRLTMKDGQHVGDVLDWIDALERAKEESEGKILIQAPTASRKTTSGNMQLQAHGVAYDWYCPTQDLAKQIANDERYGAALTLVMKDHNPDFRNHSSTYNGATKIRRHAIQNGYDLSERVAVVDEIHDFGNGFYKRMTIRDLNDVINLCMAKIGISATMPDYVYGFEGATRYIIERETPITMPVYFVTFSDDLSAISSAKLFCQFPIFHINDKNQLKALKSQLKSKFELEMSLFTADSKEEEEHQAMVLKKQMPKSDLLGCTNLMNCGYSFFDDRTHAYFVSYKSCLSPFNVTQLLTRVRNREHCKGIFIYSTNEKRDESDKPQTFDKEAKMINEIHKAQILADGQNAILDNLRPFSEVSELERLAHSINEGIGGKHGIRLNAEGRFEVDRLAISQQVEQTWAHACNANWSLMASELAKFHIYVENDEVLTKPKVTEQEVKARKMRVAETRKAFKDADKAKIIKEVEAIQDYLQAAQIEINWQGQTKGREQYAAAGMLLEVQDSGVTFNNAKSLIVARAEKISPTVLNDIKVMVMLARLRCGLLYCDMEGKTPELKFYGDFLLRITVGDQLRDENLEAIIHEVIQRSRSLLASRNFRTVSKEITKLSKSKQARRKLLKSAFKVKTKQGREGKKRFQIFEIVGEFPERIELEYKQGVIICDEEGIHDPDGLLVKMYREQPTQE